MRTRDAEQRGKTVFTMDLDLGAGAIARTVQKGHAGRMLNRTHFDHFSSESC